MRWWPVAILVAVLLAAQPAQARVKCSSGATVAAAGGLRIFAVYFRRPHENNLSGHHQYACLNGHGPARAVGEDYETFAADEAQMDAYVLAGGRYLAAYGTRSGEGGGDSTLVVTDLRSGRRGRPYLAPPFEPAGFLVGGAGELVASELHRAGEPPDGRILRLAPLGGKPGQPLSRVAGDVALTGRTLYWSEAGAARSATLPGSAADGEPVVLTPAPIFRSGCGSRRGVTVLRVARLRVARHAGAYFACRAGEAGAVALPAGTRPATLRVAGDRWLLAQDDCSARVIDVVARHVVITIAPFAPGRHTTLLDDGTLAWIDDAGALLVRPPGGETTPLATGATALASRFGTVYWTAGGAAHLWQPPAQAASSATLAGASAVTRRRISSAPAIAPARASAAPASSAVCRPST